MRPCSCEGLRLLWVYLGLLVSGGCTWIGPFSAKNWVFLIFRNKTSSFPRCFDVFPSCPWLTCPKLARARKWATGNTPSLTTDERFEAKLAPQTSPDPHQTPPDPLRTLPGGFENICNFFQKKNDAPLGLLATYSPWLTVVYSF